MRMILKALEPISHGSMVRSNITLINAQKVIQEKGTTYEAVPIVSGNQMCNRAIRTPGVDFLINICKIKDLTEEALQWLYNGGNLTQGGASVKIDERQAAKQLFPLFSLLGGAFANQLLGGKLRVQNAYLCCKETRHLFQDLPDDLFQMSCYDQIQVETFTNMDPGRDPHREFLILESVRKLSIEERKKTDLMPYERTSVAAGSHWVWSLNYVLPLTELEQGCLNYSLSAWDGYVGGRSSRGFGRFDKNFIDKKMKYIDEYKRHLEINIDKINEFLHSGILK